MRSSMIVALALCCLTGCATTGSSAVDRDLETELGLFEAVTPDLVRGQPIYSAQQAVYIADLVLALQGINVDGRQHRVSYFEGVYLVIFSPCPANPVGRYTVHIAAADSEVLRVAFDGRRPLARTVDAK